VRTTKEPKYDAHYFFGDDGIRESKEIPPKAKGQMMPSRAALEKEENRIRSSIARIGLTVNTGDVSQFKYSFVFDILTYF